ncbi:type IV pilus twitching motility protein PilT [Luteolibacter sp. Populi]|uniref:type IV pilus twitching motility protein PilT n=1 Tax=Luteolibacter sp. Populi TaxID=3230487 RepID=UPI0034676321
MAVIDTFLKLMVEKRAERLVLVSDAVPYLLKAGETIELSMPALRGDMLRRIEGEITGQEPSDARREGRFQGADQTEFGYHIHPSGEERRIEIHASGAPHPVEIARADDPVESAVAAQMNPPAAASPVMPATARTGTDLLATIDQAISGETSDIFLSSGKPPRVRRRGLISRIDASPPDAAQILQLLPDDATRREFEQTGSTDFAVRWELSEGSRRFRVNVFRHLDGVAAALRPIRLRIPSLAELNLPDSLLDLVSFTGGLVLVTGTSGSGKSTTLAALIDHLNRTRARHVITIEDPVEFQHREVQCLIHQREVGLDVESFSAGLRAALRENPDVILLGELRDLDTISAALTAAETGHLVLATLHSGSASSAVNRIVDVFPGHQQQLIRVQLSTSLRAVLSQRLVPTRSKSMIPAIEKLIVTPAVASGIREGHDHYLRNAMLTGGDEGMITLERSLATMVRKGTIDLETATRHAVDQQALAHLLE